MINPMKDKFDIYGMPNTGCLLGTAYQTLLGRLTAALCESGLAVTSAEYLVLRVLYSNDGLRQCDIAEALGKNKAAICRCITGMVGKGLVATQSISHKCQRVFLTAGAKAIEAQIMSVATKLDRQLELLLTAQETEILRTILTKIIENN